MNSERKQKNTKLASTMDLDEQLSSEISDEESDISDENRLHQASTDSDVDTECNMWDNRCKIIPKQVSPLVGYHLMPTCGRDPDIHPVKRQKFAPEINAEFMNKSIMGQFRSSWFKQENLASNNLRLITNPFKVCVINKFLANEEFLNGLKEEFYELDWNSRSMDLYEFFQSKDLKYLNSEYLRSFFEFLQKEVLSWVSELTQLPLTHVSATCSVYTNTDFLLVHDDQREDRMVAFILYLTRPNGWNESMGGALQLFDKDEDGHPRSVVENIFPAHNQFIFFPVTDDSYHQVAEVKATEDCRMSINGWFHTKIPPVFKTPIYKSSEGLFSKQVLRAEIVDIDIGSWINDEYLNASTINLIQRQIEEDSEISLSSFLKPESFIEILQTLQSDDICWNRVGPPNRYNYETINLQQLPHTLERFLSLFRSQQMFTLLQKYTDLELETPKASMKFELQRWTPGSYSLLTDYDWQEKNELDLIMYFGCRKPSDILGARTLYVTIEDEIQNALITLDPEENNLNIVYRDSARFTKYYSRQSKCQHFFTLICSYSE